MTTTRSQKARGTRAEAATASTEPLRVCHVVRTLGAGGAQDLLVHLAREAPNHGLRMSVLSLSHAEGHVVTQELRDLGVPVVAPVPRGRLPLPRLRSTGLALRELAPDVVHTHGKRADVVAGAAAMRQRLPQVSTLHLVERPTTMTGRLTARTAGGIRNALCARVVVVSEAQRQWYLQAFRPRDPSRITTVHNGVPAQPDLSPEDRRRVRSQLGITDDEVLALAVGLLREDRGHAHLLEARRLLPAGVLTLVIAGDGPLRHELEQAARTSDGARVVFTGFRRDVPQLLAAADLLVHPSLTDALPTAVLQALAAGLPVVASDVDGVPEIVGAEAGLLVPPASAAALARALTALALDGDRRATMADAARRRHAERFTAAGWAALLAQLYAEVATRPARRR